MTILFDSGASAGLSADSRPKLISELKPGPITPWLAQRTGSENWSVAFAPDASFVAWSSGFRRVALVPWNAADNCPATDPAGSTSADEDEDNENTSGIRSIDCGDLVWSLAFEAPSSNFSPILASKSVASRPQHVFSIPQTDSSNPILPHKTTFLDLRSKHRLILAVGLQNGRIRIFDVASGKLLLQLIDHTDIVRQLSFAPDGSLFLLSASYDKTMKLWDLNDDGNMCKTFKSQKPDCFRCCAWSPDCAFIASGGTAKSVALWSTKTWSMEKRLVGHSNLVSSVCFSSDNALLASASYDTSVIVWNYVQGTILTILWHMQPPPRPIFASGANDHYVLGLSFSRDGHQIASVCDDGQIRFWDLLENATEPIATIEDRNVLSCAFSPSGACLAVGKRDGALSLFSSPSYIPSLAHLARHRIRSVLRPAASKNGHEMSEADSSVQRLPLPWHLKEFLQYSHMQEA